MSGEAVSTPGQSNVLLQLRVCIPWGEQEFQSPHDHVSSKQDGDGCGEGVGGGVGVGVGGGVGIGTGVGVGVGAGVGVEQAIVLQV